MFLIHWPVTCKWGEWSDWSECSSAFTTSRGRRQSVEEGPADTQKCDSTESEVKSCRPEVNRSHHPVGKNSTSGDIAFDSVGGSDLSAREKVMLAMQEKIGKPGEERQEKHEERSGCTKRHPASAMVPLLLLLCGVHGSKERRLGVCRHSSGPPRL